MIQAQPYRKGARHPGLALTAMLKGRDFQGRNSQDVVRRAQVLVRAGEKRRRPERPKRPQRPAR
jgi:hypothetical protein